MKKYIVGIMAAALLVSGCGKFVRDELITMQNEIDQIHNQVTKINESLDALREIVEQMAAGGYVVDVQEFTDEDGRGGYTLVFNDDTTLKLYSGVDGKDGEDAVGPAISITKDEEGHWCWTIDGEIIILNNNPLYVDYPPQLKIDEEGYWCISLDNGETWEQRKDWPARGKDADEIFNLNPKVEDDYIELVLSATGETIRVPYYLPLDVDLVIEGQDVYKEVLISPGETLSINYTLTGKVTKNTLLVAGTDGRFKTAIKQDSENPNAGTVEVTCPETFPEGGYIYITLNDGNGRSKVTLIRFILRELWKSVGESVFEADADGKTDVRVTFRGNCEAEAVAVFPEGVDPWFTLTKEVKNAENSAVYFTQFTYDIQANEGMEARSAYIVVTPKGNPGFEVDRITVTQAGKPAEGGSGE